MKQHKHAELIKKWADGAEIEALSHLLQVWYTCKTPIWEEKVQYRVRHEHQALIDAHERGDKIQYFVAGAWVDISTPAWFQGHVYRVKPEEPEVLLVANPIRWCACIPKLQVDEAGALPVYFIPSCDVEYEDVKKLVLAVAEFTKNYK